MPTCRRPWRRGSVASCRDDRHFESINIWRSAIAETVRMMPLAVCDMRSVRIDDIVFGDGQNTGNIKQYTRWLIND